MTKLTEFGERLRRVRVAIKKLHGDTQGAICRKIGLTQSRWSNWEAGLHPMDTLSLMVFLERYDVSAGYLLNGQKAHLRADLLAAIEEQEGEAAD